MGPRKQEDKRLNVLLVMDDTILADGIMSVLSTKKHLQIHRQPPDPIELERKIEQDKITVIIINSMACPEQASEYLFRLFSNSCVMKILMVDLNKNSVEIFKKQEIMLTKSQDFSKLF